MDLLYFNARDLCVCVCVYTDFPIFQISSRIIHFVFISIFTIMNQAVKTDGKGPPVLHPGMGGKSFLNRKNGR